MTESSNNNNQYQQTYIFDEENKNVFELKLTNFSGPLDFLLHLVKENKIEIKDIFLSQVTEQFLQYMTQLSELDVDKASEYMAISATLLEIKSRALLPALPSDEEDAETSEQQLIRQLEEYKVFKEIVGELKEQENVNRFYREPEKSVGATVSVIKDNLSIEGFMAAFNNFLLKLQSRNEEENVSRAIVKETFTVADRITHLREILTEQPSVKFFSLFSRHSSRLEIITTFSAILEMLKLQLVSVKQAELFEDFEIERKAGIELSEEDIYESIE